MPVATVIRNENQIHVVKSVALSTDVERCNILLFLIKVIDIHGDGWIQFLEFSNLSDLEGNSSPSVFNVLRCFL